MAIFNCYVSSPEGSLNYLSLLLPSTTPQSFHREASNFWSIGHQQRTIASVAGGTASLVSFFKMRHVPKHLWYVTHFSREGSKVPRNLAPVDDPEQRSAPCSKIRRAFWKSCHTFFLGHTPTATGQKMRIMKDVSTENPPVGVGPNINMFQLWMDWPRHISPPFQVMFYHSENVVSSMLISMCFSYTFQSLCCHVISIFHMFPMFPNHLPN